MSYEDNDDFDRDYDRPVRTQSECPNCGEYYGESGNEIRECAYCGAQGCTDPNCIFAGGDMELCDDCIDELYDDDDSKLVDADED